MSIKLIANISSEAKEARSQGDDVLRVLKGKKTLSNKNLISSKTIYQKLREKKLT